MTNSGLINSYIEVKPMQVYILYCMPMQIKLSNSSSLGQLKLHFEYSVLFTKQKKMLKEV